MDFIANLLPHLLNGLSLGLLFALIALRIAFWAFRPSNS